MNYLKYEEMLNRVMKKCPLESGVQALVFMYLDELFENCTKYEPVITDDLQKSEKSTRYRTKGGYSDILVVNRNFDYDDLNVIPDRKFFVEVKTEIENLSDHYYQLLGQLLTIGEGYITNGEKWEYYKLVLSAEEREEIEEKYVSDENQNNKDEKAELVTDVLGEPTGFWKVAKYNDEGELKVNANEFLSLTEHFCKQIRKLNGRRAK